MTLHVNPNVNKTWVLDDYDVYCEFINFDILMEMLMMGEALWWV
jgi:hypothetical protein